MQYIPAVLVTRRVMTGPPIPRTGAREEPGQPRSDLREFDPFHLDGDWGSAGLRHGALSCREESYSGEWAMEREVKPPSVAGATASSADRTNEVGTRHPC